MNQRNFVLLAVVFLGVGSVIGGGVDSGKDIPPKSDKDVKPAPAAPADVLPKDAIAARKTLSSWMGTLVGKTQVQVEKDLGKASQKTTWNNKDQKELLLVYKLPDDCTLGLYFHGDAIVTVSVQLLNSRPTPPPGK